MMGTMGKVGTRKLIHTAEYKAQSARHRKERAWAGTPDEIKAVNEKHRRESAELYGSYKAGKLPSQAGSARGINRLSGTIDNPNSGNAGAEQAHKLSDSGETSSGGAGDREYERDELGRFA